MNSRGQKIANWSLELTVLFNFLVIFKIDFNIDKFKIINQKHEAL